MKREKLFWSSVVGFFIVCLVGTLCHGIYPFTGGNRIIGMFVPVNESVWEHLKLLYFPFLLYTLGEYIFYGRKHPGFLFSRMLGVLSGMVLIPVVFFLYTSVFGRSFVPVDILLFFIAVLTAFVVSFYRIVRQKDGGFHRLLAAILLIFGITALFIGMTFFPPDTALFRSP